MTQRTAVAVVVVVLMFMLWDADVFRATYYYEPNDWLLAFWLSGLWSWWRLGRHVIFD